MNDEHMPEFPAGKAFVAGGSGGIGSAIALALAKAGCDVVLTYNRNRDKAEAAADRVRATGRTAETVGLDLEDAPAVAAAIDQAAAGAGLHTVVYATGPYVDLRYLSTVDPELMRRYVSGDVLACYNLVHPALPHLRRSKGSLVAVTTTATARWALKDGLSAVPKAAVNAIFTGVAKEEGRFGVRANMVALGVIEAGMFHRTVAEGKIDDAYLASMGQNVPLVRPGRAEEVAEAVVYLASSRASYTTGQVLYVDGGFHL